MSLALAIVVVAVSVLTVIAVFAVFVWGAVKDGQDEAARQAGLTRLRFSPARAARPRPRRRSR